ncbi:DUF2461 domain-containing protein [Pseudoflavitalea sp. G-6-1-2]|uniref:DUF2461 domain-containing protein n=1 Tax=Pseudoflavitalea sp. G-6-1-2 TaxID=2728841 RepID=UPI00146CA766|nr:DUF2461 domain-containing protein [Pseudoflavitalea sp. G-6-1-2]NML20203.1 DUF2461 domain-containing protein [Pseudoflavitalea sp. G-6-1-2]
MIQASTLTFFRQLRKNNHKQWFDEHRAQYDAARADIEQFLQALIDKHGKKDPEISNNTGKASMYRINRDIRFSKDKTPYKSHQAAGFGKGGKKAELAGYYVHIEPDGKTMIAGGLWMPSGDNLKHVRQEIDYCYDEFSKIIKGKKFKSQFGDLDRGEGMSLVKVPAGFEKDNPAAEELKLKSWLVQKTFTDAEVTSKDFLKKAAEAFETMMPLIKFLNRALEDH